MNYKFISHNEEGIDFVLDLEHDEEFSKEQFDRICMDILIMVYKEKMKSPCTYIGITPDDEALMVEFKKRGFSLSPLMASFVINTLSHSHHENDELAKVLNEVQDYNYNRMAQEDKNIMDIVEQAAAKEQTDSIVDAIHRDAAEFTLTQEEGHACSKENGLMK